MRDTCYKVGVPRFAFPFLLSAFVVGGDWCATSKGNEFCLFNLCRPHGQSEECRLYVACYEKTGGTVGALDTAYGPKGACWSNGVSAAQSCTAACTTSLDSLRSAFPASGC